MELFYLYFSFPALFIFFYGLWRVFKKAGRRGWESLIPVYGIIIFLKIIHKPWWWLALLFIPFVDVVIFIWMLCSLAYVFGKRSTFQYILAVLFFPLYVLYLGFSSAEYQESDI